MAGVYGVTETTGAELKQLVAGNFHAMAQVTVKSGEGALSRGTVLAKDASSGKYVALDVEGTVTGELIGTGNGTATDFSATLANSPVIARTVTITAGSVTATDNGHGKLNGTGVSGTINYDNGAVTLKYSTAPASGTQILAAYTHGNVADTHLPICILAEDVDATSTDKTGQAYFPGEYKLDDLVWPTGISAANKARAIGQLASRGIILK